MSRFVQYKRATAGRRGALAGPLRSGCNYSMGVRLDQFRPGLDQFRLILNMTSLDQFTLNWSKPSRPWRSASIVRPGLDQFRPRVQYPCSPSPTDTLQLYAATPSCSRPAMQPPRHEAAARAILPNRHAATLPCIRLATANPCADTPCTQAPHRRRDTLYVRCSCLGAWWRTSCRAS